MAQNSTHVQKKITAQNTIIKMPHAAGKRAEGKVQEMPITWKLELVCKQHERYIKYKNRS